jgi:hypothetical protein
MTPEELRAGFYALTEQLYSREALERRRAPFFSRAVRRARRAGESDRVTV